ncbi:hypothetical protein [Nocardia sp. SSK8]|uniref:hypothetical protein n=1 Tax=Nocardia sp. SSK8 TaxID=3120154 RepID=UPI00300AD7F1
MTAPQINEVIATAWPFVTAAIGAYGANVLSQVQSESADATVALGRRILRRILGTGSATTTPALAELAADPGSSALQQTLRVELTDRLHADPACAEEVAALLRESGKSAGTRITAVAHDQGKIAVLGEGTMNVDFRG